LLVVVCEPIMSPFITLQFHYTYMSDCLSLRTWWAVWRRSGGQ